MTEEHAEIAKATKSVALVTVILDPAFANARAIRFLIASLFSAVRGTFRSRSIALAITNASSTPIPNKINGKFACTGPNTNPNALDKPNPAIVLNATIPNTPSDTVL